MMGYGEEKGIPLVGAWWIWWVGGGECGDGGSEADMVGQGLRGRECARHDGWLVGMVG